MNEIPYTKREQDLRHEELLAYLRRIEEQTKKTNGTVAKLTAWMNFSKGAILIMNVIGIPLIGWLLYSMIYCLIHIK